MAKIWERRGFWVDRYQPGGETFFCIGKAPGWGKQFLEPLGITVLKKEKKGGRGGLA